MMWSLMFVGMGGAAGAMCRYMLMTLVSRYVPASFPYGTFAVNILGALLLGAWIAMMANMVPSKAKDLHMLVSIGFLGGFTTFSAFTLDTFMLIERGMITESILYVVGSFIVSLLALIAGMYLVRLTY